MKIILFASSHKDVFIKEFGSIINVKKTSYHIYDFMSPINNMISNITGSSYDSIAKGDHELDNNNKYNSDNLLKHELYRISSLVLRKHLLKLLINQLDKSNILVYNTLGFRKSEILKYNFNIISINKSIDISIQVNTNHYMIGIAGKSEKEIKTEIRNYIKKRKDEFTSK